jgi:hypothetical protein
MKLLLLILILILSSSLHAQDDKITFPKSDQIEFEKAMKKANADLKEFAQKNLSKTDYIKWKNTQSKPDKVKAQSVIHDSHEVHGCIRDLSDAKSLNCPDGVYRLDKSISNSIGNTKDNLKDKSQQKAPSNGGVQN